jgi:DNA repair protein RadC
MQLCDTPQGAADYWRAHVEKAPYFNQEAECFIVLHLNTRRRVKGHHLASIGTLDTLLVHPREVFRAALIAAAGAIVLMHNLCVQAHKLCSVKFRRMCSSSSVAFAPMKPSQ